MEQLIAAPVVFATEAVSLFFARALFVWFYNSTGFSVLAGGDLSRKLRCRNQPALTRRRTGIEHSEIPDLQRVIVLSGTAVIMATRGQLGRRAAAQSVEGNITGDDKPQGTAKH